MQEWKHEKIWKGLIYLLGKFCNILLLLLVESGIFQQQDLLAKMKSAHRTKYCNCRYCHFKFSQLLPATIEILLANANCRTSTYSLTTNFQKDAMCTWADWSSTIQDQHFQPGQSNLPFRFMRSALRRHTSPFLSSLRPFWTSSPTQSLAK